MSIELKSTVSGINVLWTGYLRLLHSIPIPQSIKTGHFNKTLAGAQVKAKWTSRKNRSKRFQ